MRVNEYAKNELIDSEIYNFARQFDTVFKSFLCEQIQNRLLRKQICYAVSLIGVRERAFLVKISSQLCGVRWQAALPVALAAECFISSALTGDDIVDQADTRWRRPTVWRRWDENQAWLVTEMLHALAHVAIARLAHQEAAELVRFSFTKFFEGQFKEITLTRKHSKRLAIELARERTGNLLQACLVAPALMADSMFYKPLFVFGLNFGTAFQLADDVFDFIGDPKVMGKPILGDLLNGQSNIVLAHALEQRDGDTKRMITRWLAKGVENRPKNVNSILQALQDLGSLDFASRLIHFYVGNARKALNRIPDGKPKRSMEGLVQLICCLPVSNE